MAASVTCVFALALLGVLRRLPASRWRKGPSVRPPS